MLFLGVFSHRFLLDLLKLRTRKTQIFLRKNNGFCKISVFNEGTEKGRFWLHFRKPNQRKFYPKSFPKICFFFNIDIYKFCCDFGSIFGSKIAKKTLIFEKMEVRRRPLKHCCFRDAFWMDFEALGVRFWLIFDPYEAVFWLPKHHRI